MRIWPRRLEAQDTALSRLRHGFESRRGHFMHAHELRRLLEQVQAGNVSPAEAQAALQAEPVADLGYATVALHRRQRCGFPEVIFCSGKTPEHVAGVVRELAQAGQDCLATRVSNEQAAHLAAAFPDAEQDRLARTFWLPSATQRTPAGMVLVL